MEVVQELTPPFTEQERVDFIIENNNLGNIVEERETGLVALAKTKEEVAEEEKKRVSSLKCTKRVLALALKQLGIEYRALKEIISTNPDAELEWELCVELERSNPLLDIVGKEIGLTPTQIDNIFIKANEVVEQWSQID